MREFHSITRFIEHLAHVSVVQTLAAHTGLKQAALMVEKKAKSEIGNYQGAVGPFDAWSPLADSTQADRIAKGYSADDPLLRDGTLRDSIQHELNGLEAVIGSELDIALYQEVGTKNIPPRSFLGSALASEEHKIVRLIGAHAVEAIASGNPLLTSPTYLLNP